MATSYTTNARLQKPAAADRTWDVPLNANADYLDALPVIGGLVCSLAEVPSASLNVRVSAGSFISSSGVFTAYAGTASQAVTTATTNYLYLTDGGTLAVNTTGFPAATNQIKIATVVAGATTITSITDSRTAYNAAGGTSPYLPLSGGTLTSALTVSTGGITITAGGLTVTAGGLTVTAGATAVQALTSATGITITTGGLTVTAGTTSTQAVSIGGDVTVADAKNLILNTTTGTKIGTAVGQKLGFWNATPIVQPASASQAALTDSTTGTASTTLADVTATPTQTLINNNFASIAALLDAIRTALVNAGLMKGSA